MAASGAPRRLLVTGAGSGIGKALCVRLVRAGNRVVGTVRDASRAQQLAHAIGGDFTAQSLELEDGTSIAALAAAIVDEGPLDGLVHNAGFGVFGAVETVAGQAVERQLAVNLTGPLALTRALLPTLREQRGRVVWVGSLAGRFPLPYQAHYSASKAAVAALSDAMRMELAPLGVTVTCVEPGDFSTGFTAAREFAAPVAAPYGERTERCRRAVEASERSAPSPDWAAAAIAAALSAKNPPPRVVVGEWARTLCLLDRLLPARVKERVIRWRYRV